MMGRSWLIGLLLLELTLHATGQDEIVWIDSMEQFSIAENTPNDVFIYQLLATYRGSSEGIIYGINNNVNDDSDNSVNQEGNLWRVYPNGTVVGANIGDIDKESPKAKDGVTINFIALVEADPTKFSKRQRTLSILDVNDNAPEFTSKNLEVAIEETKKGTIPVWAPEKLLLTNITVVDVDTKPSGTVQFIQCRVIRCRRGTEAESYLCNDDFEIRPQGNILDQKGFVGDFYIKKGLDYESGTVVQVTLQAYDGVHKTTTDVVINVIDIPDSPPQWIELPTLLESNDTTPALYPLGTLVARDTDGDVEKRRNISYTLIPSTGPNPDFYPENVFGIYELTGVVYNKVPIDREAPPFVNFTGNNIWSLNVKACEIISYNPYDVGNTYGLDCINGTTAVKVNDVNDMAPQFQKATYIYYIFESMRNGENLDRPEITIFDADSDQYNQFTVQFLRPSAEFKLSATDRSPVIQIKDTSLIDYETRGDDPYRLTLIAVDNDNNALSSMAEVIIYVNDSNDNQPTFSKAEYFEAIREDVPEGTTILQVQATDIDTDLMGTRGIRYYLEEGNPNSHLFDLNEESGVLTVATCAGTPGVFDCIDYEIGPTTFIFQVRAQDEEGTGPGVGYAKVTIRILDVNDNRPEVANYTVDIFELETVTRPKLEIQGSDRDEGDALSYSIAGQPVIDGKEYWQIFTINGTGYINATQPIRYGDAPLDGTFKLEVRVTDSKYSVISYVTINVIDINDNAPRFLQETYTITIPESTGKEVFLRNLLAEDADDSTTANGMISYSIKSGALGQFAIDSTNGSFYTSAAAKFDASSKSLYTVIVEALDNGSPEQLSGIATVFVNITDTNDKAPRFVPYSRRLSVLEDTPVGQKIQNGTLTAIDPDKDASLRFYLENPVAYTPEGNEADITVYNFSALFRIGEEDATIYVNQPLNHDKTNVLKYDSVVLDITPQEEQRGVGTVIIDIIKVDKRPPVFSNYTSIITIPEGQPIGTFVTSFVAIDADGVVDGFTMKSQKDNYFDVSYANGVVTIKTQVDYDDARRTNDSYFIVEVRDKAKPPNTATASVSVIFRNINDNTPAFTKNGKYSVDIDENLPDGERVIQVSANDADRPDFNGFADIRYSMNDKRFDVDPMTGWIYVRRNGSELDREKDDTISVQVTAYDTPDGPVRLRKQKVASVSITLLDVNDNPPVFVQQVYRDTIYEVQPVDSTFLTLFTTDEDLGLFGRSHYKKVPGVGNDTVFFGVNKYTGQVYVNSSLQNHVGTYFFQVEARDENGKGPFRAYANVTVIVLPPGNTVPVFVRPPRDNDTIEILEEQYNGMWIYDVHARDVDSGVNGLIDYMFVDGGEETLKTGAFEINKVTGVIQAEIIFDRETTPKYVLLLKAKDRGETKLEATRFLTVKILDVNDNKPYFKENELDFRVEENAPNRTEVKGQKPIEAFDRDENPVIHYKIIYGNVNNAFYLDHLSAKLYTNKVLDAEVKNIYTLDILAYNPEPDYTVIRNRKKRALDPSILTVKVLVGSINDEAPVFSGEPYYGCVSSRSSFDKHILTVSAKDYDAKDSGVVRYKLMNSPINGNGQPLFGISETFGILSNKVLMREYVDNVFKLTVNARDQEDPKIAESVNTTATVYVTQPGKEAKLVISQNTAEVRLYLQQIQRIIENSDIEGDEDLYRVCINTVRDHRINTAGSTSPVRSDVYISAVVKHQDTGATRIVTARELKNIILTEMSKRPDDFENLFIITVEDESSEETSVKKSFVLIVLVIIAILIFLVILFIILACLCIRAAKQEKKSRLIQRTQAGAAPIPVVLEKQLEPQAVFVAEHEPVQYDNRAYIVEQSGPPPPQEQMIVEPEPVHVTYAVVKRTPEDLGQEVVRAPTPVDHEDVIIVSQFRDDPQPVQVDDDEFRIVTETM